MAVDEVKGNIEVTDDVVPLLSIGIGDDSSVSRGGHSSTLSPIGVASLLRGTFALGLAHDRSVVHGDDENSAQETLGRG